MENYNIKRINKSWLHNTTEMGLINTMLVGKKLNCKTVDATDRGFKQDCTFSGIIHWGVRSVPLHFDSHRLTTSPLKALSRTGTTRCPRLNKGLREEAALPRPLDMSTQLFSTAKINHPTLTAKSNCHSYTHRSEWRWLVSPGKAHMAIRTWMAYTAVTEARRSSCKVTF